MVATIQQRLSFEDFLAWDDGSGRSFELREGIAVSISEPNANIACPIAKIARAVVWNRFP
jgi:hypothetical protein